VVATSVVQARRAVHAVAVAERECGQAEGGGLGGEVLRQAATAEKAERAPGVQFDVARGVSHIPPPVASHPVQESVESAGVEAYVPFLALPGEVSAPPFTAGEPWTDAGGDLPGHLCAAHEGRALCGEFHPGGAGRTEAAQGWAEHRRWSGGGARWQRG
jgi:hypothetical protein